MITIAELLNSTKINGKAARWGVANLDYLNNACLPLFGSSVKLEKGSEQFESYVLYLQPADKVATKTLCPMASEAGCKDACLISSGQLGMGVAQNAATRRTILSLLRPVWFESKLLSEIDKAERKAYKAGNKPALFRLNGTSDIDFTAVIDQRPNSMFYDYSKNPSALRKAAERYNYDVTYSGSMRTEKTRSMLGDAVRNGERVAMAFNTKGLKSDALSIPTGLADFDATDLRHMDPKGIVGALKRKGSNKAERAADNEEANSFFVTAANLQHFNNIIARG